MPTSPATARPLWQRLLLRRLKFLLGLAVVVLVLLGGSYLFAPQWLMHADVARQAMQAKVEKHSVQAGDTTWSYYEGGQKEGAQLSTLVLLHGFGANKEMWLPLAEKLTAHFHVIIPDLPGWGESSRDDAASYNIDAQAARLQAFAQALGLRKIVLVGHSMGGAIAGVYAAEHSEYVGELALLDSFGLKANANDFSRDALAGRNPFVYDDHAGFARLLALTFKRPPTIPDRFIDRLISENQHNRAFIDKTFNELRHPDQYLAVQNRLGQLNMPVLGLWCHDDKIIDISALDNLRAGLIHTPSISTTIFTGCNHVPILEKPEETARILTGFALPH